MKKQLLVGLGLATLLFGTAMNTQATPTQWTVGEGANNHWYDVITTNAEISWEAAFDATIGSDWHLVTVGDANEDSFVFELLSSQQQSSTSNYWLGGYQPDGNTNEIDPAEGWSWVTGESWDYTNWYDGEPNNGLNNDQHYLHYWPNNQWDDMNNSTSMTGYIIEKSPDPVPEPATVFLFGTGLVGGLAGIRLRKKK